jgi:hypothetical protein
MAEALTPDIIVALIFLGIGYAMGRGVEGPSLLSRVLGALVAGRTARPQTTDSEEQT